MEAITAEPAWENDRWGRGVMVSDWCIYNCLPYIYVYTYTHMTYVYVYIHIDTYIYIYTYYTYTYIYIYIYIHIYIYTYRYIYTYIHIHIYTYIYTIDTFKYTCIYMLYIYILRRLQFMIYHHWGASLYLSKDIPLTQSPPWINMMQLLSKRRTPLSLWSNYVPLIVQNTNPVVIKLYAL